MRGPRPTARAQLVRAKVSHARNGGVRNAFTYDADYVLAPMSQCVRSPAPLLFAHNGIALIGLLDRDHGAGDGRPVEWARGLARAAGLSEALEGELWLLAHPRVFGFVFNPVSFWFLTDALGALRAVIAEVNNTFGERCAYVCARQDHGPIGPDDELDAAKRMHVSPFQEREGRYSFWFNWRRERLDVRIAFCGASGRGFVASLSGVRKSMSARALLASLARSPTGSLRVLALIFWQALNLRAKGERYRPRPKHAAIQRTH